MAAFHEAIKLILAEVDKFLGSTLKDENLSKSAHKERSRILDSLQKLFVEYEVLNPNLEEGSSTSSKDESRFTVSSTHSHGSHGSEEDGSIDSIPYTTVKALTEPIKLGYLQKKPTDLLEKLAKQKKYCVIHRNILYWFKKPTDKKHQGAIFLSGYECKDLTQNDKEFVFELKSNKKKSYQFQADSKEDLEDWMRAVDTGTKFVDQIQEDIEEEYSGDEYEPIDEVVQAVRRQQAASNANMSPPSKQPPLPATPQQEEEPQGEYADGFSMPAHISNASESKTSTTTTATASVTNNTPPLPPVPTVDELEDDDDLIYEFVESPPEPSQSGKAPEVPPPRPPLAQQSASQEPPPLPTRGANIPQPPLPPISAATPPGSATTLKSAGTPPGSATTLKSAATPPTPKTVSPSLDIDAQVCLEEDFANLFYGLFTCVGDSANELSFDMGDVIHVLNRDLDLGNWWVGESYGKVGLVPKEFLTPAYEMLA